MKKVPILAICLFCIPMFAYAGDKGFFADPNAGAWTTIIIGTDFTDIQKYPSLPKGKYIANAMAVLASQDSINKHWVDCILRVGEDIIWSPRAMGFVDPLESITLPLTIGFEIEEEQDLAVACRAEVAGPVLSQPSPITVISVNKLEVSEGSGL